MLNLSELKRAVAVIEPLIRGAKLQRIVQTDECTLQLEFYGWDQAANRAARRIVLLSCHPKFARMSMPAELPKAPPWPPEFAAFLKARADRARCTGLRIVNDDRQVGLLLETKGGEGGEGGAGGEGSMEILLSLIGPRSNLYALDLEGRLLAAMRPLANTRTDLEIGQPWANPEKRPLTQTPDRWADLPDDEICAAIEVHYAEAEAAAAADELQARITRSLRKELEFAERKERNLKRDLEKAHAAREKKQLGELLKTVMPQVKPGATSVTAKDFETGEEIEIPLDPGLNAAENLERYFKRYHKGLIGANMLGQQLEITRAYLSDLRRWKSDLAEAKTPAELQTLAQTSPIARLLEKYYPKESQPTRQPKQLTKKKDVPGKMLPRRYASSDGLEVWVGKSDAGNDYLSTKLAGGNDLFFHIDGYPGSHTVLRTGGRKDPPQESMLEAAELCIHFSKLKEASRVDVHIVPIKHVHKPKGAKPGLVHVSGGKTMPVRRDKGRLRRILDARIRD